MKLKVLFITIVTMFFLISYSSRAEEMVTYHIANAEEMVATRGVAFDMDILIKDANQVVGYQLELLYNHEYFDLLEVKLSDFFAANTVYNTDVDGKLVINYSKVGSPLQGDSVIFTLRFLPKTVVEGIAYDVISLSSEYHHEIIMIDANSQLSSTSSIQASFSQVMIGVFGDLSGDKQVSILDVGLLQLYLAGLNPLTEAELSRVDANQDGQVSIMDVILMQLYLAGRRTSIGPDIKYYINFNTMGGTSAPRLELRPGEDIDLEGITTYPDYELMGWFFDEDFTEPFDLEVMPKYDLTIYAKWEYRNDGEEIDFSDWYPEKSEITVWMDDQNGLYMQALIQAFNQIYPNVVVNHQHVGTVDARELLKIFGPSGLGADVFVIPHDHLAQSIMDDLVYTLPQSTLDKLEGHIHPVALEVASLYYDYILNSFDPSSPGAVKHLYGVPMSMESIGLYYNKDLVTTVPTTFEALLAEVSIFNQQPSYHTPGLTNAQRGIYGLATSSHWADSYFMQPFYSAFGFYPFGPELNDPNQVGFVNAIDALSFMVNQLKPQVTGYGTHNSVIGNSNFENGLIPYIIAGPWMHPAYRQAGLNYGVAPFPTLNGQAMKPFVGSRIASIYKYSDNKEVALKFIEFLSTETAMKIMYDQKYMLPALTTDKMMNISGLSTDEHMLAMAYQINQGIPMPNIRQLIYYWGPGETMIMRVWNNGFPPSTAAAEAEQSYRTQIGLYGN